MNTPKNKKNHRSFDNINEHNRKTMVVRGNESGLQPEANLPFNATVQIPEFEL